MQGNTIAQEQWSAIFGQEAALVLQNDTQSFEEFMAQQGRDWELADRPWQEQMWLMDAQLQMLASGYDWLEDNYNGGMPAWMVMTPDEGTSYTEGTGYTTHPGGYPDFGYNYWLDADGNPTSDPNAGVAPNPNNPPPPNAPNTPNYPGGHVNPYGGGGNNQGGGWF